MPDPSHAEKPRACENCSRAKAKCVWPRTDGPAEAQICQRCSKSNLPCSRLQPKPKKKRGKAAHAKIIERKLDDIMAILNRDRGQPPDEQHSVSSDSLTTMSPPASLGNDRRGSLTQTTTPSSQSHVTVVPGFHISFEEADVALQNYISVMLPQFPFVPLRFSNPHDLYKDRPLLLRTILWTCRPPDPDTSAGFERWFRQYIAQQTVVFMEKSLEILQALLVFFAWNDIHFYAHARDTSLLHLAMGLVGDMGLIRSSEIPDPTYGSIVDDAAHLRNDFSARDQHTSDDRRTVLGVFYITSILSSLLGKPSRLEYSPYLDDCCTKLLQNHEYPTDYLLVNLVRIRKIATKVDDTFRGETNLANDGRFQTVHALAIATIKKELDTFMDHLPGSLKGNHLLCNHYAAIRIRLFEPAIHTRVSDQLGPPHLRSRLLWDCLRSTQMLFDAFFLIPVDTYPSFTFVSILHIALAIIKAARLLCMDDRDWDIGTARGTLNLQDTLQRLCEHFEAGSRIGSLRSRALLGNQPLFSAYAENFREIKDWYLSQCTTSMIDSTSTLMDPGFVQNSGLDSEFWQQLFNFT